MRAREADLGAGRRRVEIALRRPWIVAGLVGIAAALWLLPIDSSCLAPLAIVGILVLGVRAFKS